MPPRFLADHNLNELIIDWLFRDEPAAEFLRVRDVGLARASDDQILAYAAAGSMIVVTNDVNTMIGFRR
jgi:predicted nuclease of predicted toxin-antitoxin system